MRHMKVFAFGFGLGLGVMTVLPLLMGAVRVNTRNIDHNLGAQERPLSLACDNGGTVYVADEHHVYKSSNRGIDWQIVLSRFERLDQASQQLR